MARRKSGEQPVRVPTGGDFGARKQLESMQQAIPLPATTGGSSPSPPTQPPGGGGAAPLVDVQRPDIFGPTRRPDEPLSAGVVGPGGLLPDDPTELLRAVYLAFPSPGVRRLLERAARMSGRPQV